MIISFLENLNNKVLATSPCALEDLSGVFDMISGYLGIYLAMVRQDLKDMLHRCQLCVEIRGGYVEDVGA